MSCTNQHLTSSRPNDLPEFSRAHASFKCGGLREQKNYPLKKNGKNLITIITVVYNDSEYLQETIESVLEQDYEYVEYVVVDGGSTDDTLDLIKQYDNKISLFISEPDKGLYDAINKGISLAYGDFVGILNSGDFYVSKDILSKVAAEIETTHVDSLFADLSIVEKDSVNNVKRYYSAKNFTLNKFKTGWMPPHPTFFLKKQCYIQHGLYDINYKIAADYDLLLRMLVLHKISYSYLPLNIIKMRHGGISNRGVGSVWRLNREIMDSCRKNKYKTNLFWILLKYPGRFLEYFKKPEL